MTEIKLITVLTYLLYLIFFTLGFVLYSKFFIKEKEVRKRFFQGYLIKILSGLSFIGVYGVFYGGWGDSYRYYMSSSEIVNVFLDSPINYLKVIFTPTDSLPIDIQVIFSEILYLNSAEELLFSKIISLFAIMSFNNYLVITMFFSLIAFVSSWKVYRLLNRLFINAEKYIFFGLFLVPSLFFWGGCVLKDGFIFSILCFFISILLRVYIEKKVGIASILWLFPILYLMLNIKAYVIISFVPALLIGLSVTRTNKIKNFFFRKLVGILLISSMIISSLFLSLYVGQQSEKYDLSGLESRIKGFHGWHAYLGGSTYDLGEIEFTFMGIVKKIPSSLNVTFFRPYLWEVHNIVMLTSALESMFYIFLAFKYVLIKDKFFFWLRTVKNNPILITMLVFCIIFGFSVGFTSYNFGALVRYKIPCLPFFYLLLVLPNQINHRKMG
jgi:hypothetical protein